MDWQSLVPWVANKQNFFPPQIREELVILRLEIHGRYRFILNCLILVLYMYMLSCCSYRILKIEDGFFHMNTVLHVLYSLKIYLEFEIDSPYFTWINDNLCIGQGSKGKD